MSLSRTGWLGVVAVAALGFGALTLRRWPTSEPALACDASEIGWIDAGGHWVAVCGGGEPRAGTLGQARALGLKVDLNQVSEEELARLPGIGSRLARALVSGREARNGFRSWEEVNGIPGVGPAKLKLLQDVAEIRR